MASWFVEIHEVPAGGRIAEQTANEFAEPAGEFIDAHGHPIAGWVTTDPSAAVEVDPIP